jgi:hypothetical protein
MKTKSVWLCIHFLQMIADRVINRRTFTALPILAHCATCLPRSCACRCALDVLSDGPPLPAVLVYNIPIQARHPSSMSPTVSSRGVRHLLHWPTSIPFRPSSLTRNTRKYRRLPQYTQRGPCKSRRTGNFSIFWFLCILRNVIDGT